jgi:hypothetical protein
VSPFPGLGARYLVPGTSYRYNVPCTGTAVLGNRYLVPGTRHGGYNIVLERACFRCTSVWSCFTAFPHCYIVALYYCIVCNVLYSHCCIRIVALIVLLRQAFIFRALGSSLHRYFFFCLLLWGETTAGHQWSYVARSVAMPSESENLIGVKLCSMLCSNAFSEHGTEVVS